MWKISSISLTWKVFIFMSFSIAFYKKKLRKSLSRRNANEKKNSLNKQKHWYLIHTWSDQAFNATVVNQTLPSLYCASLEITFTVPLMFCVVKVEIPRAGLVFRGALDSNWNVKGVLEKKLLPLPLTLSLCGLLNHPKQSFQMGAGLIMG